MLHSTRHGGRRGFIAVAATVVLALVGTFMLILGFRGSDGPPQPPAAEGVAAGPSSDATTPGVTPTPSARPTSPSSPKSAVSPAAPRPVTSSPKGIDLGPILAASTPTGLDIPAIGVHEKSLVNLALNPDGTAEVPQDADRAGWYSLGPTPGQFGPAVIAGHVDQKSGPAVFYRLGQLRRGETITVPRQDGSAAKFVIDKVARYPKDDFPTREVYGNTTNRAELRLITCGGAWNPKIGHYVDNIVVFSHLVA